MRERVRLDPEIAHLQKDEGFRRKLSNRIQQSRGWGFLVKHKGLRIRVLALDGNFERKAYLEA